MDKSFQVNKVEILKEGTNEKTGKDWVLYKVFCSGDDQMKEFSTFKPDYMNGEGQQFRGNFEYDSKWKNWKEISVKQAEESTKHDELLQAIRFTAEQNKKIIEKLEAITNFFIHKNNGENKSKETGFDPVHDMPDDPNDRP